MKKNTLIALLVLISFTTAIISCKKSKDEEECRTCKAYGIDAPLVEETVCSDAEEAEFRSDNAGKQISCE